MAEETSADLPSVDISPAQDGGVLKQIIKEGTGEDTPQGGDNVKVHYTGRLEDGTKFDSSKDRNSPFEFELGKGSVIKGWDVGIGTMKRGECAYLTCKPEYAYGENGNPPTIPAKSTLVFEVELLDWNMEDLSQSKDGGIQRRILTKGDGYVSPKEGAKVEIHLVGKLEGKVFEDRQVAFDIGDGAESKIVEGVETALKSFKNGEKSLLKLTPNYAYGSAGNAELNIPSDATVEFEVELKSFEKVKEIWEMNSDEKIEQSIISKNKGTDLFKAGKFESAVKQYSRVVTYLENDPGMEEQNESNHRSILLAGHLNLAACYLKTGKHQDAINACDKALQIESNNVKGFFRRGQARVALKDYESARTDFEQVLKLDLENKAAQNQLLICKTKIKEQVDKEKQTYKNMFAKFAEEDKRKDALRTHTTESGVWQNGQRVEDGQENQTLNLGMENVELLPNEITNPQ